MKRLLTLLVALTFASPALAASDFHPTRDSTANAISSTETTVQVDPVTGLPIGVPVGRSFSNITTNTTTVVKSGEGFLHSICVNTKGATANTAAIYDNTAASGTKIGTLDTTAAVGCMVYDIRFGTGLTVVTATGTAPDLTVSYR